MRRGKIERTYVDGDKIRKDVRRSERERFVRDFKERVRHLRRRENEELKMS